MGLQNHAREVAILSFSPNTITAWQKIKASKCLASRAMSKSTFSQPCRRETEEGPAKGEEAEIGGGGGGRNHSHWAARAD